MYAHPGYFRSRELSSLGSEREKRPENSSMETRGRSVLARRRLAQGRAG